MEATRDQWQAQGILQQEPRSEAWLRMLQGIWPDAAPGSQLAFVVSGGEGQFWYRASAAQTAFTPLGPRQSAAFSTRFRHLARSAHHLSRTASAVDRRYTMKRILTLGLALLMLILAGCSTEVTEYRQQQPALDIFHYFQGRTEAWGMVQDRSGKQLRHFHVEIDGDVVGDTLTSMSALSMTTARSSSGYGAFAAPAITVIRAPPAISKAWPAARRQAMPFTGATA